MRKYCKWKRKVGKKEAKSINKFMIDCFFWQSMRIFKEAGIDQQKRFAIATYCLLSSSQVQAKMIQG